MATSENQATSASAFDLLFRILQKPSLTIFYVLLTRLYYITVNAIELFKRNSRRWSRSLGDRTAFDFTEFE